MGWGKGEGRSFRLFDNRTVDPINRIRNIPLLLANAIGSIELKISATYTTNLFYLVLKLE